MNIMPSECGELVDVVSGKPVMPMDRTYGARICGGLKLPTEMCCDSCRAALTRESSDSVLGCGDYLLGGD